MSRPRTDRLPATRILTHLVVMVAVAAVLGVVVAGLAIPFAGIAGIGAKNVAKTMDDLPAALETGDLPQKTRIVDPNGRTIATLFDENRVTVPLKQMSRTMVKAIVAIEDFRFYQHGALDMKGTLRALVTNQANSGVVQGGSSITQQLVKLTLLDQAKTPEEERAATDDTYARKLKELRYAIALEQNHTKDWILERYLNTAYFGDGAYGVQAAARHYFNVNARDLDLRQSAMLAGLVKNPTGYDPTNSPDRALERRNVVIDRMAQLQVITPEKAERVRAKDLGLKVRQTQKGCLNSTVPFFCDYVVKYLLQDESLGKTEEERMALLQSGGLTIRTTVDLGDQAAADASVASHVYPTDQAIGGMAMVEPGTGEVKAIAQSRPMGRDKAAGQTYLNYVIPQELGDSAGFQAGSTFKPFVLAAAVNQGIPLSTVIDSPPEITLNAADFANCPGAPPFANEEFSTPNSTTSGPKNLYTGTRESVNTFYMQLEERTGVCEPYNLAKAMGVDLTNPVASDRGLAERIPYFTLGVASVSPLEMSEAYATFGARGLHCDSRPVTSIQDSEGNTLKDYPAQCTQVMPQSTADAVNDVLRGVQEPGGFGYDIGGTGLNVPSAGKTGTTNSGFSVWFMGYTPQLATSAMIAGANVAGTPDSLVGIDVAGSYVSAVSGSGFAGPMWADAMQAPAVEDQLDDEDFVKPSAVDVEGVQVTVPNVQGMTVDQAQGVLADAGFTTSFGGSVRSSYNRGNVAYTSPGADDLAASGSQITIYTSNGRPIDGGNSGGDGNGGRGGGRGGR